MTAIAPDVSKCDAWRPERVARLLEGVGAPWYIAAGWAIDLFLGGERREHEDLEIAVPNTRFDEVVAEALAGFEIFVITDRNEATPLAHARDRLADTHQTWVREPNTGMWRFDVFREPSDGDTNQADLDATLPRLGPERRRWLREALELVHPAHPWLAEVEKSAA